MGIGNTALTVLILQAVFIYGVVSMFLPDAPLDGGRRLSKPSQVQSGGIVPKDDRLGFKRFVEVR